MEASQAPTQSMSAWWHHVHSPVDEALRADEACKQAQEKKINEILNRAPLEDKDMSRIYDKTTMAIMKDFQGERCDPGNVIDHVHVRSSPSSSFLADPAVSCAGVAVLEQPGERTTHALAKGIVKLLWMTANRQLALAGKSTQRVIDVAAGGPFTTWLDSAGGSGRPDYFLEAARYDKGGNDVDGVTGQLVLKADALDLRDALAQCFERSQLLACESGHHSFIDMVAWPESDQAFVRFMLTEFASHTLHPTVTLSEEMPLFRAKLTGGETEAPAGFRQMLQRLCLPDAALGARFIDDALARQLTARALSVSLMAMQGRDVSLDDLQTESAARETDATGDTHARSAWGLFYEGLQSDLSQLQWLNSIRSSWRLNIDQELMDQFASRTTCTVTSAVATRFTKRGWMSSKAFAIDCSGSRFKVKMLQDDEFLAEVRGLLCFHTAQRLAPAVLVLDPVRRLLVCPLYPATLWETDSLTLADYQVIIRDVLAGLEHVAGHGLAHCDIHARNILINLGSDGQRVERAVVNDFGFSVPTGTVLHAVRGHEDFCSLCFRGVDASRPMAYETRHDMEMFMWSLLGMVQRVTVTEGGGARHELKSFTMDDRHHFAANTPDAINMGHPLSTMFPPLFQAALLSTIDQKHPGVTADLIREICSRIAVGAAVYK